MPVKQKFSGWLLMVLLVAPLPLMVGYLHLQQRAVKKAVKRTMMVGVANDELVLLRFSHAETETQLRWEHSREFEFDGEMYDIVRTKETADSVAYWCWHDREETTLNRRLERLAALAWGEHPQRKACEERLILLILQLDLPGAKPRMLFHTDDDSDSVIGQHYRTYAEPEHAVPVPPPEMV